MTDLTPQAFVERWERVTLSERSSYQQHFLDLCDMLDEPKPAASDETGSSYTFEKRVEKTGGALGSPTCGAAAGSPSSTRRRAGTSRPPTPSSHSTGRG